MANNVKLKPNVYMTITPTLVSQDIATNKSTVKIVVNLKNPNGTYSYSGRGGNSYRIRYVIKNGSTTLLDSGLIDFNYSIGNINVYNQNFTIDHNANGTPKSTAFSVILSGGASQGLAYTTGTTADTTLSIPTIPRYTSISSFKSSSITRNSFVFSFSTANTIDRWEYRQNGGSWTLGGTGDRTSASVTRSNLSANTTYKIQVRVRRKDSQLWTESSEISVTTLAIASPNTPTLSSRTCIQAVINWSSNRTVRQVQYRIGTGAWQSTGGVFSARTSGSFTITGLNPNTTYSIQIRVNDAVHTGSWSGASTARSVTTYRLTTVTGTNFNLGDNTTSAVSRATTSTTHIVYLQGVVDGMWVTLQTSSDRTGNFTTSPSSSQRTNLENSNPTASYARVRWRVDTYWGGVYQGHSFSTEFRANIIDANPTLASATYADVHSNSEFVAWKGGAQKILRNISLLRITLGKADALRGATLAYAQISIGSKQTRVNYSSDLTTYTGLVLNPGAVNVSSDLDVTITVVDSRGNTGTRSITVEMVNYQSPSVLTAETQRLNNYEPQTNLLLEARYFEVKNGSNQVNYLEAEYRVKQKPSGSWGSWVPITVNSSHLSSGYRHMIADQFMSNYSSDNEYDVEIRYKDYVTSWITTTTVILKGIELLAFYEDRITTGVPLKHFDGVSEYRYIFFADYDEIDI